MGGSGVASSKVTPLQVAQFIEQYGVKAVIEDLIDLGIMVIAWSVADIQNAAKTYYAEELSEEHAKEVLYSLYENHDANKGITWYEVEQALSYYLNNEI